MTFVDLRLCGRMMHTLIGAGRATVTVQSVAMVAALRFMHAGWWPLLRQLLSQCHNSHSLASMVEGAGGVSSSMGVYSSWGRYRKVACRRAEIVTAIQPGGKRRLLARSVELRPPVARGICRATEEHCEAGVGNGTEGVAQRRN